MIKLSELLQLDERMNVPDAVLLPIENKILSVFGNYVRQYSEKYIKSIYDGIQRLNSESSKFVSDINKVQKEIGNKSELHELDIPNLNAGNIFLSGDKTGKLGKISIVNWGNGSYDLFSHGDVLDKFGFKLSNKPLNEVKRKLNEMKKFYVDWFKHEIDRRVKQQVINYKLIEKQTGKLISKYKISIDILDQIKKIVDAPISSTSKYRIDITDSGIPLNAIITDDPNLGRGMYIPDQNLIVIKLPVLNYNIIYNIDRFNYDIEKITSTVKHEVIHYIQFASQKPRLVGLSKKNIRNGPEKIKTTNSQYDSPLSYASGDIEYKTLMSNYKTDIVNNFKYFEKKDWGLFFKFCINMVNTKEMQYMGDKYPNLGSILSNGYVYRFMGDIKAHDFPRWKAIAKELYDDIYNR